MARRTDKDIEEQMHWLIGTKHPHYGRVAAMGIREGEPYRFFTKDGEVSLIPLNCLQTALMLMENPTSRL